MNRWRHAIKFFAILALLMAASCKPKASDSDTLAIVSSDGKSAFTLIPLRNVYTPAAYALYDDDAAKVENALRLTYVPIECTGDKARLMANLIESTARANLDGFRREGSNLFYVQVDSKTEYKACRIIGTYGMGAGSLLGIFAIAPKTQGEFEVQQSVWLAARGQANLGKSSFSTTFYTFLSENIGAVPRVSFADVAKSIQTLDAFFNPCVGVRPTASKFDKTHAYRCTGEQNYEVVGNYSHIRDSLIGLLNKHESKWWQDASALHSPYTAGIDVASRLSASITADLGLSGKPYTRKTVGTASPGNPGQKYLAFIKKRSSTIEALFRIVVGNQLVPPYTFNNPRKVEMPPILAASDAVSGLALTGGVTKVEEATTSGFALSGPLRRAFGTWRQNNQTTYRAAGTYQNRPVYQTATYGATSTGQTTARTTDWTLLGRTDQGDYMWKRESDSGIYYADGTGRVTRNASGTNSTVTGTNSTAVKPTPIPAKTDTSTTQMSSSQTTTDKALTDWQSLTNSGMSTASTGKTQSTQNTSASNTSSTRDNYAAEMGSTSNTETITPGPSRTESTATAADFAADTSANTATPVPERTLTSREDLLERAGVAQDFDMRGIERGEVMPNVKEVVGLLPQGGKYGNVAYDKENFNCQSSAASTCSALGSLFPGANQGVFAVELKGGARGDKNGGAVHAANWLQTGTDAGGKPLYQVIDPQSGRVSKPVSNLTDGVKDINLADAYAYDDVKVRTNAGDIKTYNGQLESVLWDSTRAGGTKAKTFANNNGETSTLYNTDGSFNFDYLPPRDPVNTASAEATSSNQPMQQDSAAISNFDTQPAPILNTSTYETAPAIQNSVPSNAADPVLIAGNYTQPMGSFGGYSGSSADQSVSASSALSTPPMMGEGPTGMALRVE